MNPRIEWCDVKTRRCLVVEFDGHLSHDEAQKAIATMSPLFNSSEERLVMV